MTMEDEDPNQPKQMLRPRHPGEDLKIAETVLRRRNRIIKGKAETARKMLDAKKVRVLFAKIVYTVVLIKCSTSHTV